MIANLYAKYLLADRLNKVAEAAGVEVYTVTIGKGDSEYSPAVNIQCHMPRRHASEDNEEATERLLTAMPGLALRRSSGLMFLDGVNAQGLTYRFYTGSGVCERVQVGTRTVPRQPARKAVPAYEEPIFEVRCVDPLNALVAA